MPNISEMTTMWHYKEKKVKEVDLYSAFIVVPHTQGAQVRITQITNYTEPAYYKNMQLICL